MHELYLAECIVKQARAALPQRVHSINVSEVKVRIGELDAVVTDTLVFMYDAIKSESGFANSRLVIETEAIFCICNECAKSFELAEPLFMCPHCLSTSVRVVRGRGVTLTEITIQEKETAE
ncbi:MAG: hydrogenase maturation nickel metallochaperone HypA [Calditrichaeota bacterium]|nr:hydrogenase maturation nickel metallochaperone HypA [Calditrichota bacterium]